MKYKQVKSYIKLVLNQRIEFIRHLKRQMKFNDAHNVGSNEFVYKVLKSEREQVKILEKALLIIKHRGNLNKVPANKTSGRALELVNYYHSQ